MTRQLPASARSAADFFCRALSSFQSSQSKLQIICTAASSQHRRDADHDEPTLSPPAKPPRTIVVLDSSFNPPTRAHLSMATTAILDLAHKHNEPLSTVRLLLLLSVNNADKSVKPAAFDKRLAMMWAFAADVLDSVGTQAKRVPPMAAEGRRGQELPDGGEGLSVDIGLTTVPYFHEKSALLAKERYYHGGADDLSGSRHPPPDHVFLVGYDTLIRIFNPKYYNPPSSTTPAALSGSTPMQNALDPFFGRARLRVTLRADDEWGGVDEQSQYLHEILHGDGLEKIGGSRDWGKRIDLVEARSVGTDIISSTYARAAAKKRDPDRLDLMVTPGVKWWIEQEGLYAE
ncbi:hypothetical protein VTJ83DRAFT_6220 [Remersonia thermophila]|uniref:Nicotinamide-nucleotide adenylyltransferase n=1 Tax=Remersonia thermophila TaxID=72144 RepID=A0ABR4D416_9PEZI